jgi:hypothetical protein
MKSTERNDLMRRPARLVATAGAVVALAGGGATASGSSGIRLLVKIEVVRTASDGTETKTTHPVLPTGTATFEYVTDGQSVRKTLHGQMAGLDDGAVMLLLPGRQVRIDPARRTYSTRSWPASPKETTHITRVEPTMSYDTVLGHKVRRVDVSLSREGQQRETTIQNWCASDVKLPKAVADDLTIALGLVGSATSKEYAAACSVPLRCRVLMSAASGVDLLWTATVIESVTTSPDLFVVPPGFTEVPW